MVFESLIFRYCDWQKGKIAKILENIVGHEAPPAEIPTLSRLVKQEMELVKKLNVPLLVEVGVGENWRDL